MDSLVYNIPAQLARRYRGRRVILRSADAIELAAAISETDPSSVLYAQLLSLDHDIEPLIDLEVPTPLDLILSMPLADMPLLYGFAKLLEKRQVRVSVRITDGFAKAVRLALALNFAVKLELDQPDPRQIEELETVLDLYLHRSTVAQPVEYFHSTFVSYFQQQPLNLWSILEEDPAVIRFVTDDGQESVAKRLSEAHFRYENGSLTLEQGAVAQNTECDGCEFFDRCGGYFKWPIADFDCGGVKRLFGKIRSAAEQLRDDVNQIPVVQRG